MILKFRIQMRSEIIYRNSMENNKCTMAKDPVCSQIDQLFLRYCLALLLHLPSVTVTLSATVPDKKTRTNPAPRCD